MSKNPTKVRRAFLQPRQPEIQACSLAHFMVLEDLDCALAEQDAEPTVADVVLAAYVLSQPDTQAIVDVYQGPGGRKELDKQVLAWAAQRPLGEITALSQQVSTQIRAAFATVLPSAPKAEAPVTPAPDSNPK